MGHDEILSLLKKSFPKGKIDLVDTVGDGNHWKVKIVSKRFTSLSTIQQHRLVYEAISKAMKKDMIHAMSISTSDS